MIPLLPTKTLIILPLLLSSTSSFLPSFHHFKSPPSSLHASSTSPSTQQTDSFPSSNTDWRQCIRAPSPKTCPLNEAVSQLANVSLTTANDLISIGAVWAQMDILTQDDILAQYSQVTPTAQSQYADLPRGWGGGGSAPLPTERRYKRILTPVLIPEQTNLRIYPHPRRFPACKDITPSSSLLYEDTTFVIVDKPPMLPTQPDASNYFECVPGCVQKYLGPFEDVDGKEIARPLLCHRVDTCVGGCVVLSKDGNGQKVFHQFQRDRLIKKLYLTVTSNPVPLGMHVHWMWAPLNLRGQSSGPPCQFVSHEPPSNKKARDVWTRCILEVTSTKPITISNQPYYESTIRLVTGRKHQVRAQLSSLNCPILGDTLYEPIAGLTLDQLEDEEAEQRMDEALQKCRVPDQPIGLQAHAILFGGIRVKARDPWWVREGMESVD